MDTTAEKNGMREVTSVEALVTKLVRYQKLLNDLASYRETVRLTEA